MSKIRNIVQTHQEREIIKTAPDTVVYLDGLPYVVNPYLDTADGNPGLVVNFNDHLAAFNASYDVDNLVPSATITFSVPNDQKYMYQAPGGVKLIESMMEVQVFSKGYYLAAQTGNTLFHRVFRGLTSHVGYTDNGKTLEISLGCYGVLHFLEVMQVDLNPALQTASPIAPTVLASYQAHLNPYLMLTDMLVQAVTFNGFQMDSLAQENPAVGMYKDAIQRGFVAKWNRILDSIKKEIRIYGVKYALDTEHHKRMKPSEAEQSGNPQTQAAAGGRVPTKNDEQQAEDLYIDAIRGYLPDMSIGSIQLLNGRITSRLERIRTTLALIGYEGFQDIDGKIVMKPPLWNLDVTNIGSLPTPLVASASTANLTEESNPFIIHLPEIENEQETEDQAAVRLTRCTVQGDWSTTWHVAGTEQLRAAVDYFDAKLMSQFGLRQEPPKTLAFLRDSDKKGLFAFAVNELMKANRGWRTYTFTIPMRPELHLGFPCYIPHRDFYGYVKSVSPNYNQGQNSTMTVTLDCIRTRPMFPKKYKDSKTGVENVVFVDQPNLVHRWTDFNKDIQQQMLKKEGASINDGSVNVADEKGAVTMLPPPPDVGNWNDQRKIASYRKNKIGATYMVELPTLDENGQGAKCYRVQEDKERFYTQPRKCDGEYIAKVRYMQPYTDEKGYELISPFPWGRWRTLKQAINDFLLEGALVETGRADTQLENVRAFLFAGLGTPAGDVSDTQAQLSKALNELTATVNSFTVFELSYTNQQNGNDNQVLSLTQSKSQQSTTEAAQARAKAFLQTTFTQQDTRTLTTTRSNDGTLLVK